MKSSVVEIRQPGAKLYVPVSYPISSKPINLQSHDLQTSVPLPVSRKDPIIIEVAAHAQ